MQPYHFINLSFEELQYFPEKMRRLVQKWQDPCMKIDRLIATSPQNMIEFLKQAFTSKESIKKSHSSTTKLILNIFCIPYIDKILQLFQNLSINVQMEILCDNSCNLAAENELINNLLEQFPVLSIPRFSFIHSQVHLDFTAKRPISRKRNRNPPLKFQKKLKSKFLQYFPACLGSEYYGNAVFNIFEQLFLKSRMHMDEEEKIQYNSTLKPMELPLPPSPMKYYDLQNEQQNWIELRLSNYFEYPFFIQLMELIQKNLDTSKFQLFRSSFWYDSWMDGIQFRRASHDQVLFSQRDIEFAFYQQNPELLSLMKKRLGFGTLYFQLTAPIEDNDFRVNLLGNLCAEHNSFQFR